MASAQVLSRTSTSPHLSQGEPSPAPTFTSGTFSTWTESSFTSSSAATSPTLATAPFSSSRANVLLVRNASDSAADDLKAQRQDECSTPVLEGEQDAGVCHACGDDPVQEIRQLSLEPGMTSPSPDTGGFDRFSLPSAEALFTAQNCELIGESGATVTFGQLVKQREKVVVVFLRHLWCGLCQSYVKALKSATKVLSSVSLPISHDSDELARPPPLYILLISSGSPSLIPIYRARLDCPFPLYVDKRRVLYKTLGMTKKTWDGGKEKDKGSYVTQSKTENIVTSTANAFVMRGNPGSQKQLGGEFVFSCPPDSNDIQCLYASRMSTTRNHSEVEDLFAAAGVTIAFDTESAMNEANSAVDFS